MDDRQVTRRPGKSGRIWAGCFLVLVGGVLLLDQMGFPLPDWLFSWHILLIAIGLFIGLRHNFRGGAWLIMILVGGGFLIQDYYPQMEIHRFLWPGILIFVGLVIMLRPRRSWQGEWKEEWKNEWKDEWRRRHWRNREWNRQFTPGANPAGPNPTGPGPAPTQTDPADPNAGPGGPNPGMGGPGGSFRANYSSEGHNYSSEDFIDTTSVFGGVHKKVVSKNFKGGDITTFLGGTEIDLSQADFNGIARLDVTQVCGGTKIIVPPHWEVRSEVTAIFAGFEDKRQQPAILNPEKILIIDGTSIFGGIELKNF